MNYGCNQTITPRARSGIALHHVARRGAACHFLLSFVRLVLFLLLTSN